MAEAGTDSKPQPASGLSRWTPSIPTSLMSMLNPFANDDNARASTEGQPTVKRQSILASFLPNASSSEDPPSPEKDDASDMFAEPDTNSNSDDASREGSVDDSGRRRSKRSDKPKTSYSICHPAPSSTARQKLHRRPRSLLQLHKLCSGARPRPAYEVVPSANFSVRLTRAITKVFKTKHGLCPNDLVVLKAEKYSADEPDEEQEARDIVALICKGRKEDGATMGKAKICLPGGREWEAYPTPQGGYEFFSTDEHGLGLTVRWVQKKNKDGSKPVDSSKKRFNFSTISPNSRKHPVIATLSKTSLEINDTFKVPNPSAATPLSTPKQNSTILADAMDEDADESEHCETDERLRTIIAMTGIWVTFKEGWSPNFKYDDKEKESTVVLPRSPSMQGSPSKSGTFASPLSTPPASPLPYPLEKRNSIKSVGSSILRQGSLMRKGNRNSTVSVPEGDETADPFDNIKRTGRTRADSASTVLVHRAASNRAKNHQATWRPDLLDAQREMSEPPSEGERTPQRRESVARPILPPTNSSTAGSEEAGSTNALATPRSVGVAPSPTKRGSSATTTTTRSTSNDAPRKPTTTFMPSRRKRGGWRKLFCGGTQDV